MRASSTWSGFLCLCLFFATLLVSLPVLCTTKKKPEPKIVYVLFDLSGSTESERKQYLDWFNQILGKLLPGDRIVVEAIQSQSAIRARYPVNEEIPKYSPLKDNPLVYRKRKKDLDSKIRKDVESLLNRIPGSKTTEIMSALIPAQQLFQSYPEYRRKILVMMSDMVEESQLYNFVKNPPGPKGTKWIINREKKAGRFPNLSGVKVYVVGAGGTSSQMMMRLKKFWMNYFKEAGAVLSEATYGPGLPRFEQ